LKKLTIIIINYNTKELLKKCLDVLDIKNIPEDYSIIVIDNNSPDGSADMAKKIPGRFEVVRFNENRGFPYAANFGIRKSLSEFYLILNSDTEVKQIQLADMLKFMSENREIGAMTPFQYNSKNEPQLAWGCFPTFTSEIGRKLLQDALDNGKKWAHSKLRKLEEPFFVHWVAGSTMLLRDAALRKAGLFDENYFIFFEDIDLCTRIRSAGWKIAVCPGKSHTSQRRVCKDGFDKCLAPLQAQPAVLLEKTSQPPIFFNDESLPAFQTPDKKIFNLDQDIDI